MVMAWSVDGLGRSLPGARRFPLRASCLRDRPVLAPAGLDTTTPGGKAVFQMMGVFAEFESAMIRERVKSGLERATA
jgi:DNA invertase Pin-like site-specific DNA recombinase